jgi:hypothetical protein
MPIPQKPLTIVDYDPDELTLDESHTLFGETYSVDEFRQFLLDHVDHATSWTEKEVGHIKRKELPAVRQQLFDALIDVKVTPKPGAKEAEAERPLAAA